MERWRDRRLVRHIPAGRTLHLLDVENLAGTGKPTREELERATARYRQSIYVAADDLVVIGCDRRSVLEAGLAWPGARVVSGTGRDGADRALLAAAEAARAPSRFDRVVVGSGDHIFGPFLWQMRRAGLAVMAVGLRGQIAADVRRAACVRFLKAA